MKLMILIGSAVSLECRRLLIQDDCDIRADRYFDHFEAMLLSAGARYRGMEDKVIIKDFLIQEDDVTPLDADDDFVVGDDEPVAEGEEEEVVEPEYSFSEETDSDSDDSDDGV